MTVAQEPSAKFDYLLVDAFSSDSIPVHLITREALGVYMDRIRQDGILAIHISNRYVELMSVLSAVAKEQGWTMRGGYFSEPEGYGDKTYLAKNDVVVITHNEAALGSLADDPSWTEQPDNGVRVWTDDYSDIVSAMLRRLK